MYDATAGIPAVIEEVHDGSSVFYVREPGGALICRIDGATTNYYGFDELGSTLFLTASNGTVSDKYTYDAWGNVTSHTGSTNQPYQFIGGLGYYTHYQDTNMGGLLQLGVRYYEPETGRFTQRDRLPLAEESAYAYAGGLVTTASDADGQRWYWNWPPWKKPKPKKPVTPEEKAMKALGKWFMKSVVKQCAKCKNPGLAQDIKLGTQLAGMFIGLPDKYQNALKVCMDSAREIARMPGNAWAECTFCYDAISAVTGPGGKANYYGGLVSCSCLE